jgi:hypothetical protein
MFQKNLKWILFSINKILKHLCRFAYGKKINFYHFVGIFPLSILGGKMATSVLKTKDTNVLGDGKRSFLWHTLKNLMIFFRPLERLKFYDCLT